MSARSCVARFHPRTTVTFCSAPRWSTTFSALITRSPSKAALHRIPESHAYLHSVRRRPRVLPAVRGVFERQKRDERPRPQLTMTSTPASSRERDWEGMWADGLAPGDYFDAEQAQPSLVSLLQSDKLPKGGQAFVPGCGRGYEVVAIAETGMYDRVVGLDLSPTAMVAAREYASGRPRSETIEYIAGDFFAYDGCPSGFTLSVDYTFLCALPIELREQWARKHSELLAPNGVLVVLMFPLKKPPETGGPPHGVSFELYDKLLRGAGLVPVQEPEIVPNELAHPGRGDGNTAVGIWKLADPEKTGAAAILASKLRNST